MKTCVFPGTFDPFTVGHLDIAERAAKVFDRVIIAVSESGAKNCMYTKLQRVGFARAATEKIPNTVVEGFDGLLASFLEEKRCTFVVRGLRTVADLEYENALSTVYRTQNPHIETVFLLNVSRFAHVHGTIVRDLIRHGADVSMFVPQEVLPLL